MKNVRFGVAVTIATAVSLLAVRSGYGMFDPPAETQGPPVPTSGKDVGPKSTQEGAAKKSELAKPSPQIRKVMVIIKEPQPFGDGWQGYDTGSRRFVYVETTDHAPMQHPNIDRYLALTGYFVRDGDMTGQNALGNEISMPKYIDVSKAIDLQLEANRAAEKPPGQMAPIAKALTEKPKTPETLRALFALHAVTPDDKSIKSEDFAGVSRSERISDLTHRYQLDAAFWIPNRKVLNATFIGPHVKGQFDAATAQMVLEFLAMTVPELKSKEAQVWLDDCQEKSLTTENYFAKHKVPGAELTFEAATSKSIKDRQGNEVYLFCVLVTGDPENAPKQPGESK